ncbi:tetratricopeptide repeat protein [Candidatus Micrarchaeota archaeon]|nr:tetratricopeptide repeat protein [Candidatus Micrarchaeota archaeon]
MDVKEVLKQINTYLDKKEFKEALKFLNECGLNDPEIYNMKGIVYMNLNNPEVAEKMYSSAIEESKKFNKPTPHFFYSNKAFALVRLKRFQEAIEAVETAKKISPNDVKLFDVLANIHIAMGDYKKAMDVVEEGLKIMPGHPQLIKKRKSIAEVISDVIDPLKFLLDSASKHLKNKEPRSALDILKEAQKFKESTELYDYLTRCYWELENYEEGYKTITKAIQLSDSDKEKAGFLWIKAKFANSIQKPDEAVKLCEQAIKLNKQPNYYYDLSMYLLILRKTKDALKQIDNAIKHNPLNPHYHIRKGDILSHMHKFDEALKLYEHAISLDPLMEIAYKRKLAVISTNKYKIGEKKKNKEMFG